MKKCPSCSRTYTDDALSFCLEDGSPLLSVGGTSSSGQPASFDPGATMQFDPARHTDPPPTQVYNPAPQQQQQFQPTPPIQTPSWSPTPPAAGAYGQAQPKKKSKALYWILGSVAVLIVVGIVGVVLVVVLAGMSNSNANNANNSNATANKGNKNSGATNNANNSNSSATNKNTNDSSGKNYQLRDDFSKNWWFGSNSYGSAELVDGEYQVTGAKYQSYLLIHGLTNADYETSNANTRVTVRSVTGVSPSMGYGLTVYGSSEGDMMKDYAFIIRTDESPSFRVAAHEGGKENTQINWTPSTLIRGGSNPNQLEVRSDGAQLSFYINGQFATSITDTEGYEGGTVGLYSSDPVPVAFSDLEIYK